MKPYKFKTTRPEFLLKLMADGNIEQLTVDSMKKNLYDSNHVSYCIYTVLMDADISQDDIDYIYSDGETIAIHFKHKSVAKEVKAICNKELVRYGTKMYKVHLKLRDSYLYATAEFDSDISFNDEVDDEE